MGSKRTGPQVESVMGCFLYASFSDPSREQLMEALGASFPCWDFTQVRAIRNEINCQRRNYFSVSGGV